MFSDKIYEKKWNRDLPWIEKYRPMTINDIIYQETVIETLKKSITNNNLSHLLFYGPPGTGKTSAILAAAKEIYPNDNYKKYVLELNASDERGINIIRSKVQTFSQKTINNKINFKLIILDEADSMTIEAQSILRHIIEKYSSITRFCIICNYIDKIIEPLISRCNKFRFYPLNKQSIIYILKNIANKENININTNILTYINTISNGDLRRAITILQSVSQIYNKSITKKGISYITGIISDDDLDNYINIIKKNDHLEIDIFCQNLYNNSYSNYKILNQIFDKIIYDNKIDDKKKSIIIKIITDSYYKLLKKSEFNIELLNMSYKISYELNK